MTDSEIIKALECCKGADTDCWECELFDCCKVTVQEIMQNALDLINRQQALIKRLTSGKCVYLSDDEITEYCVEGPCPNYKTEAEIKAEAYKEFAERLKESAFTINQCEEILFKENIDNLLKEMESDNNA